MRRRLHGSIHGAAIVVPYPFPKLKAPLHRALAGISAVQNPSIDRCRHRRCDKHRRWFVGNKKIAIHDVRCGPARDRCIQGLRVITRIHRATLAPSSTSIFDHSIHRRSDLLACTSIRRIVPLDGDSLAHGCSKSWHQTTRSSDRFGPRKVSRFRPDPRFVFVRIWMHAPWRGSRRRRVVSSCWTLGSGCFLLWRPRRWPTPWRLVPVRLLGDETVLLPFVSSSFPWISSRFERGWDPEAIRVSSRIRPLSNRIRKGTWVRRRCWRLDLDRWGRRERSVLLFLRVPSYGVDGNSRNDPSSERKGKGNHEGSLANDTWKGIHDTTAPVPKLRGLPGG